MDEKVIAKWAPDSLWELAAPLIPPAPLRRQGGGRRRVDDRRVLAAILYLTQAGCSWWKLPEQMFKVTRATAHRRFAEWTAAGLFYITQDSVPRLYRGEAVAWKYVFVGWMAGMYVCAALTPAVLWLGNRWPVERRVVHSAWHLGFSVIFSVMATAIEVPVLLLLGVFPSSTPPPA